MGEIKLLTMTLVSGRGIFFPGKYLHTRACGVGRSFWAAYLGFHLQSQEKFTDNFSYPGYAETF